LEAQQAAVRTYLGGGLWELVVEFTEVESGRKSERPELLKALALCKKHKATLLIARLDRLARNVHFISGLMETNVKFVACDMARSLDTDLVSEHKAAGPVHLIGCQPKP
jgi:DNA invertase Pin-like site-specific DNA recombinase